MIKTRFSPSPTGLLHLGNVRAALFSALFAAKHQGVFILRIEDTDAARSESHFVEILQDDLRWFGLDWQEGPAVGGPHAPYAQSERGQIYNRYYEELERNGLAYPCFCTDQELALHRKLQLSRGHAPRYPGTCRKLSKEQVKSKIDQGLKPALRFQVPTQKMIEFVDLVKGLQRFNSDDIGDFIIRRAEGTASFLFCNAIDDSLMEVTHVLRGEDHLANTPRQLMILATLKMRAPQYGHVSMILGDDGSPLSKRHGSFSLHDLRKQGYLPKAVLNYLARLGNTYDTQELLSFSELAKHFQLEKLGRSPARFDKNQLLHWQKQSVMSLKDQALEEWLGMDIVNQIEKSKHSLFLDMIKHNILFPKEAEKWNAIFFNSEWKLSEENASVFKNVGEHFFTEWKKAMDAHGNEVNKVIDDLKVKLNLSGKNLFQPMRIALTGETHGPELAQIIALLGQKEVEHRIKKAKELAK